MMPEHIKMLNDYWEQEDWKEKPIIDEQLMLDINLQLNVAIANDLPIEVEYFKNHNYHKVKGYLLRVDPLNNFIQIEDKKLPLDSLTGAWIY